LAGGLRDLEISDARKTKPKDKAARFGYGTEPERCDVRTTERYVRRRSERKIAAVADARQRMRAADQGDGTA
jgi:hypothetical protein